MCETFPKFLEYDSVRSLQLFRCCFRIIFYSETSYTCLGKKYPNLIFSLCWQQKLRTDKHIKHMKHVSKIQKLPKSLWTAKKVSDICFLHLLYQNFILHFISFYLVFVTATLFLTLWIISLFIFIRILYFIIFC